MKNIILIFCTVLLLLIESCKSNIVDPPPPDVEPGRRDYVWDTTELNSPDGEMVLMAEIWGANPNDIWVVGPTSYSPYGIWHFNGIKWEKSTQIPGGGLSGIWGSSTDNIWLGNSGGLLWRYNGATWIYNTQLKLPEYNSFTIQRLWGVSANEVYAIGAKIHGDDPTEEVGIFKYDGTLWKRITMPKLYNNTLRIYKDPNGDLLFTCTEYAKTKILLLSWNGTKLDTVLQSNNENLTIQGIKERTLITYQNQIYTYNNGQPKIIADCNHLNGNLGLITGRSEKDIFLVESKLKSRLLHFNGSDIAEFFQFEEGIYPLQGITFEKDVYIILFDSYRNKSKILHGKLKE